MKHKLIYSTITTLLTISAVNSQNLNVNKQDGTSNQYSISDIKKLTFDNTSLVVSLFDGTVSTFNLIELSNYTYSAESLSNINEILNQINYFNFAVCPNPFENYFKIDFELASIDCVELNISDITGKIYYIKDFGELKKGKNEFFIPLSDLPSGTYFVSLLGNNSKSTKKTIKL